MVSMPINLLARLTLLASIASSTVLGAHAPVIAQDIIPYLSLNGDQRIFNIKIPEIVGFGWEFELFESTRAEFLGIFDHLGNGVPSGLDIGLWKESETTIPTPTLIAEVLNINGLGGIFEDDFRWYGITSWYGVTPGVLEPGRYVVSAEAADFWAVDGTFTTLPQVDWVEGREADINQPGPPPPYPNVTTRGNGNWGGNVGFVNIPPVPGPLPLLGVGAAFGFSRKLRKRINSSKTAEIMSAID